MQNQKPKSKIESAEQPSGEGLSSSALLSLGLFVVEARMRKRDKTLSDWKPICAFIYDGDAEWYRCKFGGIASMRVVRPNNFGGEVGIP